MNWDVVDAGMVVVGIVAIAWVLWYFLSAGGKAVTATSGGAGPQEIRITVRGGYDPSVVHVSAGTAVRLRFDRQETSSCSEEVVFPDFKVRKFLPAFQETVVDLPAPKPGSYEFTCGMSMLRGRMVAQ